MARDIATTAFKDNFIKRTQLARNKADYSQHEIALLLQIDQGTYKQYETRSLLPHALIPAFCVICGISVHWLFTGAERDSPSKRRRLIDEPASLPFPKIHKLHR
jgi:transcriptional regulator with XRE-family HTH domain